jgi:hypothetical protein
MTFYVEYYFLLCIFRSLRYRARELIMPWAISNSKKFKSLRGIKTMTSLYSERCTYAE